MSPCHPVYCMIHCMSSSVQSWTYNSRRTAMMDKCSLASISITENCEGESEEEEEMLQ